MKHSGDTMQTYESASSFVPPPESSTPWITILPTSQRQLEPCSAKPASEKLTSPFTVTQVATTIKASRPAKRPLQTSIPHINEATKTRTTLPSFIICKNATDA